MDYNAVVGVFFDSATAGRPVPAAVLEASPARKLRDAFEPLAMHAVWSPLVHERLAARGLDFFATYVWGRACVMGEPAGAVVAAAFGAFEPGLIAGIYDAARGLVSREEVLALTVVSTGESLRTVLGAAPDADAGAVADVASRLQRAVAALDGAGRPLFSGVQALDVPADPYAALWQACLALREHRGDAHIAAYLGEGFDPVQMNILTELWLGYGLGDYSGSRAWPAERTAAALDALRAAGLLDGDALTDAGRRARDAVEARTDAMEQGVLDALGADLAAVLGPLDRWSGRCVEAHMFPPDPRKRAAG